MFCNFSCPLGQNLEMTYNLFWQIIGQQVIYQSSNTSNPFLAQHQHQNTRLWHPARPNVSHWGFFFFSAKDKQTLDTLTVSHFDYVKWLMHTSAMMTSSG